MNSHLPYGQGNGYAPYMRMRGSDSENAPEPISAALWKSRAVQKSAHGLGYAVERTNGEWSRPQGAKPSFESAMNYFFSEQPPMSDEMGEFEGRAH